MDKFSKLINEANDISEDKVKEILTDLKNISNTLDSESDKVTEIINTLESFKSGQDKNDQIDDSYVSLKEIESLISECVNKIGEVDSRMEDYLKQGRKYLY